MSPAGVAAHPTDPTFEVKLRPTEQSRLKLPAALLRSDWSIRSCAGVLRCHWPALSGSRHIAHTSHRDRERGGCWRSAQPNWPRVEQGPTKWLTGHGDKANLDDGRYLSTFYSISDEHITQMLLIIKIYQCPSFGSCCLFASRVFPCAYHLTYLACQLFFGPLEIV